MAANQKAKSTKGTRNDARKNGKASKKRPGNRVNHGRMPTDLELVLMGKGMFVRYSKSAGRMTPSSKGSDD